jgi:histidyl-tRNA synthetase
VVLFGEDEYARGEVLIKDLRSGSQTTVKKESVLTEIKKILGEK